ncbi:hypothetical protein ACFSYD_11705 [Paracoccus aerius]
MDNVAFSAGYRRSSYGEEGGYNYGFDVNGPQSSMVGNVLAHRANPDDAEELGRKTDGWHDYGVSQDVKLVDDTQSWKWSDPVPARNVEGIDPTILDQTTIQRRAGQRLSKSSATIAEYVDHIAAQASIGNLVREDVRWVKSRFGTPIPERSTPANLFFQPDPRLEGFRWDNRYNWSTKDLPGAHVADSADLAGNFVRFGNTNADIAALQTSGGKLDVVSGKLEAGVLTDAAEMMIRKAGQVWIGDADHPLSATAISGRLALTGTAANLDLHAGGQTQVLLGPDCTADDLVISGSRARVGWDGSGSAVLTVNRLEFKRGAIVQINGGGAGKIRFVYQHIGKEVTGSVSGFSARIGAVERTENRGGDYRVWLYDVIGMPVAGDVFAVAPVRTTAGEPQTLLTISSVVSNGITPLQRFRSGAIGTGLVEPTVSPTVNINEVIVPTGLAPGSKHDLTAAGVILGDLGNLPAGVAPEGGKLVYTA